MYVLGREWWLNFFLWKAPVRQRFRDVREACIMRTPQMIGQLDSVTVILKAVKRAMMTGTAEADQPRQRRRRPKKRLMPNHDRWAVRLNRNWKPLSNGHHQRTWLQNFCWMWTPKMLTIEHKTARRKYLCRTSPVQWEWLTFLSVDNNCQRRSLGSLLRPGDENNQWNGIISRRHARKKFKARTSVGKVMSSVFWDSDEILLV